MPPGSTGCERPSTRCKVLLISADTPAHRQHLLESHRKDHHCSTCWKAYKRPDVAASCHERTYCLLRGPPPKLWLEDAPASQLRAARLPVAGDDAWYQLFGLVFPNQPEHGPEGYRVKFTPCQSTCRELGATTRLMNLRLRLYRIRHSRPPGLQGIYRMGI